jgi:hypothetical protein
VSAPCRVACERHDFEWFKKFCDDLGIVQAHGFSLLVQTFREWERQQLSTEVRAVREVSEHADGDVQKARGVIWAAIMKGAANDQA